MTPLVAERLYTDCVSARGAMAGASDVVLLVAKLRIGDVTMGLLSVKRCSALHFQARCFFSEMQNDAWPSPF